MLNTALNIYNKHATKISFVGGAIAGLVVGLLLAWVAWPTSYYNTTPESLRVGDMRDEYLVLVARDFAATGDVAQAQMRLGARYWKKESPEAALEQLAQQRGGEDSADLQALAQALREAPLPEGGPAAGAGGLLALFQQAQPALQVCGVGLALVVLVILAYAGLGRLRRRRAHPTSGLATASRVVEPTTWEERAPPFTQFKTTYTLGDDFYDPSFSIEEESGAFLGECGVGISEAIGVGDPKKVTALEVWLFDKNDIRTVTQVLMSEFAFYDGALQAKLASKGELMLAQPGTELTLETQTLVLRARVVDMEYGQGQSPTNSFFHRVTLDLGVWIKPGGGAQAAPGMAAPFAS
jgi:Na+-transporting methylmalonyl-CoA/oxaloacetate decarboxylase gamma subunit